MIWACGPIGARPGPIGTIRVPARPHRAPRKNSNSKIGSCPARQTKRNSDAYLLGFDICFLDLVNNDQTTVRVSWREQKCCPKSDPAISGGSKVRRVYFSSKNYHFQPKTHFSNFRCSFSSRISIETAHQSNKLEKRSHIHILKKLSHIQFLKKVSHANFPTNEFPKNCFPYNSLD